MERMMLLSALMMLLMTTVLHHATALECYSCENVRDPADCFTQTEHCDTDKQTCESKYVSSDDGPTLVTKRCVRPNTCPPFPVNECANAYRCRYCCATGDRCNEDLIYRGNKGQPGTPSPTLIKGERGDPGRDGTPGLHGMKGLPGGKGWDPRRTGDPGKDGRPGLVGVPGDPGRPGYIGLPGLPGVCDTSMNRQPAPTVVAFTIQSSNVINDRDWTDLPAETVLTNIGGAINISISGSAVFEAPVHGLYRFLVTSIANGDEAAPVVLFHNETKVVAQTAHRDTSEESPMGTADILLTLSAGDTVTARLRPKQQWTIFDNGYSAYSDVTFSGYLVASSAGRDDRCSSVGTGGGRASGPTGAAAPRRLSGHFEGWSA